MPEGPLTRDSPLIVRFSIFEFDTATGELWKAGRRIRLQEQACQVLRVLIERPGTLVTRDELCKMLWPEDTFVDFDTGLNVVINKIRQALDDSASTPRFVETLPRRGYRFIAPVTSGSVAAATIPAEPVGFQPGTSRSVRWLAMASVLIVGVAAALLWSNRTADRSSPGDTIQALAVIPFENLSADDSQRYLVDGITDALTTELASIHALRVVPRQSTKHYRGTAKSIGQIGRELKVDAVVQGSMLLSEDRIRLTVELIDVAGDRYRWTQTYEGPTRDIVRLQGEAVAAIARNIPVAMTPPERARLEAGRVVDPAAYDAYLRGRYHLAGLAETEAQTSRALSEFERAVALDPSYAPAYAGIAKAQQLRATVFQGVPPSEIRGPAIKAARKALALDPDLSEAHAVLARLQLSEFDWPGAAASFQRAFDLGASDPSTLVWYSYQLLIQNRVNEALETARQAESLDPLDLNTRVRVGFIHDLARDYDQAIRKFEEVLTLDPDRAIAQWFLSSAYANAKRYDDGLATLKKAVERHGRLPSMLGQLAMVNGSAGHLEAGFQAMDELSTISRRQYVSPALFAVGYTQLHDFNRAFEWLERAYQERTNLLLYLSCDPVLDPLRGDPRYAELVKKVSRPHAPRE